MAHGRLWVPLDSVMVDSACQFSARTTTFLWPAHLQLGVRSLVKYFHLMYPMSTLQETIRLTNINLAMNSFRTIGPGDLFWWIAVYVNTPSNYASRFQMSRHCFEQILYALALSDNSQPDDPWDPIRPLMLGFNDRRKTHVSPGKIIDVDD
ncbi:uncharacterized protein PITG_20741 [Phytophthora infestans T30-4]|uniref:PiggyBac transposable element-derived protein domain-containing protein n=1 Tax=Phytophthora infestans (strain T30-4) TaxID=403677 RepID=D0P2A5_PHYIT|nr:uncharacterized protein PITG_20741 [Phytophthora infestans T30-4]EEY55856.1 hypothetical protein PITG_20741 [Phytophthora infestans T30-4]|eukprot:XP_002895565.1 hypothetical protein PITG_20741 [Phytophthora infestans T30-4]